MISPHPTCSSDVNWCEAEVAGAESLRDDGLSHTHTHTHLMAGSVLPYSVFGFGFVCYAVQICIGLCFNLRHFWVC